MSRSAIVTGAGFLAIAASLGYCQVRTTQLNAGFAKVVIGDAERDVVAKMRCSHEVVKGCGHYGRAAAGCAWEYVYYPPWTIV
jgi:hypothetical protein